MTDSRTLLISGSSLQEVSTCLTKVMQGLPPELSKQLRTILRTYVGAYGIEEAYKRLNNRTVAQILADRPIDVKPVAAGEKEGLRYELYDPPQTKGPVEKEPKCGTGN